MKKIILVLLVLLCGMSLFAETYTFYTGDRTGKHGYYGGLASKGNLTDSDFKFTKIIQTINNLYERLASTIQVLYLGLAQLLPWISWMLLIMLCCITKLL